MIQCFNPSCRSISALPAGRCKVCGTPLLYRFLLPVANTGLDVRPGTLITGRFLVWSNRLWLDTRPETPTPTLEQIPAAVMPYLKLFHRFQHIPRPYAYLTPEQSGLGAALLLLDMAPVATSLHPQENGLERLEAVLLPPLRSAWANGSPLRQLNWLRQVALLWPDLAGQKVTSSLLDLDNLRVDGALLRLTTLAADRTAPHLKALGQRWEELLPTTQASVKPYLGWLVNALSAGELTSAEELLTELEGAIQSAALGLQVTVDWTADTDQGPARDRNEDACYPEKEVRQQHLTGVAPGKGAPPLLLVCDGIGGHEQGNVASQTAIKLLQQELEPLTQEPHQSPGAIAQRLKQALILANDAISARNNDEHRSARARMGTTVVVALVHFPYIFIAHIGDSRAYRVSSHTCYQITVDDDVASRDAQLGYALYSEAVQLPSGGALVQALGISDSGYLYPSVQHLLLDDTALLLLCSDGLSDYDRVEALAPSLVVPLVASDAPLATVTTDLIQQANRLNGHDNVTVGLMRFTPHLATMPTLPQGSLKQATAAGYRDGTINPLPTAGEPLTQVTAAPGAEPSQRRFAWGPFLGGMAVVLAGLGGLSLAFGRDQPLPVALQPLSAQWSMQGLSGQGLASAALAATVDVPVGSFWQIAGAVDGSPVQLLPQPIATPSIAGTATVATGSILRVISRQTAADQTVWVRLQICSIPSGESLGQRPQETTSSSATVTNAPDLSRLLAAPGDQGWVQVRQLYGAATFLELVTPTQASRCVP